MKPLHNFFCALCLVIALCAGATTLPSDWQFEQTFNVSRIGLTKIDLPITTLGSARPALEDVRLCDDAGNEIPYFIASPAPAPPIIQAPKSFHVSINENSSVITMETGFSQPMDAVQLESPAGNFIKAVRVESSGDGKTWDTFAQGQPVFRQNDGVANLKIAFAQKTTSKWLRLTVDDVRSPPVPWTGALIFSTGTESAPVETFPVTMSERDENAGETRLALDLGAANLNVADVHLETMEPLFMRQIHFAVPQIAEDSVREQIIGQGTIYRVAVPGQSASENLSVSLGKSIHSRQLILYIENGDGPPLPVDSVTIARRPFYLVFLARKAGTLHLLTGNPNCGAPRYDFEALHLDANLVPTITITGPPVTNPDYRPPEVLPGIEPAGAPLDISQWQFRRAIHVSGEGAQEIELDPAILAHGDSSFADLRVMDGSNQVPYLIERTSINRAISPSATTTNDPKNPQSSLWVIRLPQSRLPITRMTCISQTPLFDRELSLYEEVTDDRGEPMRRDLGQAHWTQTPNAKSGELSLMLDEIPQTDTLFLETENGDNPPIALDQFRCFYSATRILLKARVNDDLYLYYGNPNASSPQYDLALVADQLLAADKKTVSLAAEEQLKKTSWAETDVPGKGGIIFWGVLAVVVVVLLSRDFCQRSK